MGLGPPSESSKDSPHCKKNNPAPGRRCPFDNRLLVGWTHTKDFGATVETGDFRKT